MIDPTTSIALEATTPKRSTRHGITERLPAATFARRAEEFASHESGAHHAPTTPDRRTDPDDPSGPVTPGRAPTRFPVDRRVRRHGVKRLLDRAGAGPIGSTPFLQRPPATGPPGPAPVPCPCCKGPNSSRPATHAFLDPAEWLC
jgi:hypothetical protein